VESALGHRVAMRRLLAEHGVAQPAFAAVRTLHEGRVALETVGVPAVLRPANGSRGRAVFVLESPADLERHLHAALAESPTREAIVERAGEGTRFVAIVRLAGGGSPAVTLAEALVPPSEGWFAPSTVFGDAAEALEQAALRAARALEVRGGLACVDLLAAHGQVQVLELAAAPPRHELVALLELAATQPAAVALLTGPPGQLPAGRVRRVGTLAKVLAFPGVAAAELDVAVGDTIEPMQADGAPYGYVLAGGEMNLQAVERAEAAARLVDVEVW
jgi:formate-dependent phosphoribosylglycinamide formyltransferase (GAR transformylase)